MQEKKKFTIFYESKGPSGNVYSLLGLVKSNLKFLDRGHEFDGIWERVKNADSYQKALEILGETANLIDIS